MAGLQIPGMKPRTSPTAAYGGTAAAPAGGLKVPGAAPGGLGGYGQTPGQAATAPGGGYYQGPAGSNTTGSLSYDPNSGMVSSSGIAMRPDVDLDQQRRDRDKQDYADKLAIESRYGGPTVGSPAPTSGTTGGGGGGGGGGGEPGPGLDKNEIMDIINSLKPPAPPPREQAPGLLAREAAPQPIASPSAKSQGFARAKDNAGRIANSALQSLRSQMVARGIEGSGVEGQLAGGILGETARGVADASFQQERAAEDQAWQAAQLGYQGAINQRGQDYGLQGTGFSGNVSQRGQDIGAQPNMLGLAPTILSLLGRRY